MLENLKKTLADLSKVDDDISAIRSKGLVDGFTKEFLSMHVVPEFSPRGGAYDTTTKPRNQKVLRGLFENAKRTCHP